MDDHGAAHDHDDLNELPRRDLSDWSLEAATRTLLGPLDVLYRRPTTQPEEVCEASVSEETVLGGVGRQGQGSG